MWIGELWENFLCVYKMHESAIKKVTDRAECMQKNSLRFFLSIFSLILSWKMIANNCEKLKNFMPEYKEKKLHFLLNIHRNTFKHTLE